MRTENNLSNKDAVVIVAHPDDEILWCGGTILSFSSFNWFVACLSSGDDTERAPKFYKSLKILNATGAMGKLDDGPEQKPLDNETVKNAVLDLMTTRHFDLIITHNPYGEYTRHLRHEEVSRAVIELWYENKISANELWTFAYEDGNKKYFPRAEKKAFQFPLPEENMETKIWDYYRNLWIFFEAETTPEIEAFWKFSKPNDAYKAIRLKKSFIFRKRPQFIIWFIFYLKSIKSLNKKIGIIAGNYAQGIIQVTPFFSGIFKISS